MQCKCNGFGRERFDLEAQRLLLALTLVATTIKQRKSVNLNRKYCHSVTVPEILFIKTKVS